MNLSKQKLEGLITQLGMAQSRTDVIKIQVAMLKAQILKLRAEIDAENSKKEKK